jgi:Fe-S-cluster containining protein
MNEKECMRCGKCCNVVAIRIFDQSGKPIVGNTDFDDWVTCRGLVYTEDGWLLIPSRCPRLVEVPEPDGSSHFECIVHHKKPLYCREFPQPGNWKPFGCSL